MPTIEIAGKQIETTDMGYLVNSEDWSEDIAKEMAKNEKLELTSRHWDVINHLREEFFNNAGNQPNTRKLVKYFENFGEKRLMQKFYMIFSQAIQANRVEESLDFPRAEEKVVIKLPNLASRYFIAL